ncbi:hypothetical protein PV328_000720 [Microctonus aethiopoides]|uniref:Uncharacterized protein n=1 Tax=Microctonus aethiopoides TaxID=144406 RepID=A0AA39FVZ3_9HYME|nr:hypothetical protein PV328_000720 [Microctonus aethiopoides]
MLFNGRKLLHMGTVIRCALDIILDNIIHDYHPWCIATRAILEDLLVQVTNIWGIPYDENISKICNDDSSSMVRSGTANEEALTTNNEAIFSAVKTLIEKSEKNILDAIASAKRSLQYDFNKEIGQLTNNLNIKYGLANIHTIDVMSDVIGLGISIPITNSDGFIEFDSNLTENKEKLDILKKFILVKVEAAGHFKKAIGSAMSSLINKDVQLKYNAKGKMINGTCKKKFSSTNLYKIIEGVRGPAEVLRLSLSKHEIKQSCARSKEHQIRFKHRFI